MLHLYSFLRKKIRENLLSIEIISKICVTVNVLMHYIITNMYELCACNNTNVTVTWMVKNMQNSEVNVLMNQWIVRNFPDTSEFRNRGNIRQNVPPCDCTFLAPLSTMQTSCSSDARWGQGQAAGARWHWECPRILSSSCRDSSSQVPSGRLYSTYTW